MSTEIYNAQREEYKAKEVARKEAFKIEYNKTILGKLVNLHDSLCERFWVVRIITLMFCLFLLAIPFIVIDRMNKNIDIEKARITAETGNPNLVIFNPDRLMMNSK